MKPAVIRWPGGCFADDYHWQDGIGPRGQRPRRMNIHWGEVVESNQVGTQEFVRFCRLVGAEPYLCGNVGSGTARELRDWVEYCNFPNAGPGVPPGRSSAPRMAAWNRSMSPIGGLATRTGAAAAISLRKITAPNSAVTLPSCAVLAKSCR